MHEGERYRVTCNELGVPRTQEESYQAANRWWRQKLAEISLPVISAQKREVLAEIDRKLKYAANHAPDLVEGLKKAKARIEERSPAELILSDQAVIEQNLETARLMGITIPEDLDPTVLQQLFGDRRLWQDRLKRANLVEKHRTISHNLNKFLAAQRIHQKPATHDELAEYLKKLTEDSGVWTDLTDVATINEQTVTAHYLWLSAKNYGAGQHNKLLGFFRRFIYWLWTEKQIEELPRNLKYKQHRKKKVHKEVKRFTGVKQALEALPEDKRLWAMLGLNCGMTNADLGEASWNQIDDENWTLTRRRVKTGENPKTPTVTYKLWPETIALLKKLSKRKGLLFITETGSPLYKSWYDVEGKVHKKDLFASYWNKLDPKPRISLGKFRSIGSTTLKERKEYREYVDYFLAHAPHTVADQNYAAEADDPFFEATDFIRSVIFETAPFKESGMVHE
jgi:integrase